MVKTVYKLQDRKTGQYYGASRRWTSVGRVFSKTALKLAEPFIRVGGRTIDIIEYELVETRRVSVLDIDSL